MVSTRPRQVASSCAGRRGAWTAAVTSYRGIGHGAAPFAGCCAGCIGGGGAGCAGGATAVVGALGAAAGGAWTVAAGGVRCFATVGRFGRGFSLRGGGAGGGAR